MTVTHLGYWQVRAENSARCLELIRRYLAAGWDLTGVDGRAPGPFILTFRGNR